MALVTVDRNVRPHVSVCTLNKPERLNSMSFPLVHALYEALARIAEDNDCWVVVLTGAGRGFCSGLDLHDRGVPPNSHDLGFSRLAMKSMSYMSDVVPAMRGIPQPIIAAINGPAYGGGMCLTLGADLRYAAESAAVLLGRHHQRAHEQRARRDLPAAACGRHVERGRAAVDGAQDRRARKRCASASSRRSLADDALLDHALDHRRGDVRAQPASA